MLLLQCERDVLLKPLQAVVNVVERRHTLPILSNVLIESANGRLKLLATDLEIQLSAETSLPASAKDFTLTVAARKLVDICRTLPDSAMLNLESGDSKLTLKSARTKFSLQTLPADDFPRMAQTDEVLARVVIAQGRLRQLLNQVQYAMAQQDIRYYLNGLLLALEKDNVKLVATDGHRLSFATSPAMTEGQLDAALETIIPRKTVVELAKLLSEDDEPVRIEVGKSQLRFVFDSMTLVSKVIDGKFPDYTRVIPSNYGKHVTLDRLPLQQALQRAAILSNEKFRGVRLVLADRSLTVMSANSDQEEAQEELEVEYAGEALDIGFNVSYLLDVLTHLGDDKVTMSFGEASSSCLLTIPDVEHYKYVVMPMRI